MRRRVRRVAQLGNVERRDLHEVALAEHAVGLEHEVRATAVFVVVIVDQEARPLLLVDALPRNETGKLPRVAVEDLIARVATKAE